MYITVFVWITIISFQIRLNTRVATQTMFPCCPYHKTSDKFIQDVGYILLL